MEKPPYYKAFVAQTPQDILQSVFKNEDPVLIAITLSNGIYIEGIVIDIKEDTNQQKTVCMLSQDEQVSFFYAHSITVITVKQPKKMVVELSKGAISRPITSQSEDLSILQLKRWLKTEENQLGSHIEVFNIENLPLEEINNRLNVQDVFKALKEVVNLIIKDELGQEAWQSISTIELQQADVLKVEIQAKTLTISIAINKALPKKLTSILEEKLLQIL